MSSNTSGSLGFCETCWVTHGAPSYKFLQKFCFRGSYTASLKKNKSIQMLSREHLLVLLLFSTSNKSMQHKNAKPSKNRNSKTPPFSGLHTALVSNDSSQRGPQNYSSKQVSKERACLQRQALGSQQTRCLPLLPAISPAHCHTQSPAPTERGTKTCRLTFMSTCHLSPR